MRQVEISRPLVFDHPRRPRSFFERSFRTTSASAAPRRSRSFSPAAPGATTCPPTPCASLPRCSPSATKVIAPFITEIRTSRRGRPPKNWTQLDRDYETIRLDMQTLFNDLGISLKPATA